MRLRLYLVHENWEVEPILLSFDKLVLGGWTGRRRENILAHIEELKSLGIPPPERVPSFFHVGTNLLTTNNSIDVLNENSNGEVEYVIFLEGGEPRYLTVGSDHTDRSLERESFLLSKQIYPKVIPPIVWSYDEVVEHWDDLILRMYVDGILAQESKVKELLSPVDLIREAGIGKRNAVLFSGSISWLNGMVFGVKYRMEVEDPIIGRKIGYTYRTVNVT